MRMFVCTEFGVNIYFKAYLISHIYLLYVRSSILFIFFFLFEKMKKEKENSAKKAILVLHVQFFFFFSHSLFLQIINILNCWQEL